MQYNPAGALLDSTLKELQSPLTGADLPWFPVFNQYLGGLRPHEVTILCAPTGAGKTELLASIAAQLTLSGVPVFVAPVETGDKDFLARVISTISKKSINQGIAVPEIEIEAIKTEYGEVIRKLPLYLANYDNRVSISEIEDVLEFAHTQEGCKVALLDNLNFFLDVVSANNEKMEMDNAIHALVMFAKRIPMHTVLIMHPRKTDGGRITSEFDIKGSSTAVQECANVILFNRPSLEQIEKEGRKENHRELIFKKIRKRGAFVNKPVWIAYKNGYYSEDLNESKKHVVRPRENQRIVPAWDR